MKKRLFSSSFLMMGILAGTVAQAQIGVKNFRQIIQSYSSVTGIPLTDADVKATIEDTKSRLPKYGRSDEVNSGMLLAMTSLSGIFCQKLIAAEAVKTPANRLAHKTVDFAKIPSTHDATARRGMIDDYAQLFWGRMATDAEKTKLLSTMQSVQTAAGDTTTGLRIMLKAACTIVGSSQEFFIY